MFTLAGLLAGVVIGLLFGGFSPAWIEAIGTWFAGFVALFAVIFAVVAFRSEEFARRLEQAQANRADRAKLQQAADLVMCSVGWSTGNEVEPGIIVPTELRIYARNGSSYVLMDMTCHVPQLGDAPIRLADVIPPGPGVEVPRTIPVTEAFRVHSDSRELYKDATFTFSLGRVRWSTRYGQLADRLDP
jgi:hypothetical protein